MSGLWPLKKINKCISHIGLGAHPTVWTHFNFNSDPDPKKVQGIRNFFLGVGVMVYQLKLLCVPSHFGCVQLFVTLWTPGCQAPLSQQESWSGLPCLPPGELSDPGDLSDPHLLTATCIGRWVLYH